MKFSRHFCAATVLTCLFTFTAFAGEMPTGVNSCVAGEMPTGRTSNAPGEMPTGANSSVAGEMPTGIATQETGTTNSLTAFVFDMMRNVLTLF